MKKTENHNKLLERIIFSKKRFGKKLLIVYSVAFAALIGVILFLVLQINSVNALYAIHSANINESGLCYPNNKTTVMLFYGSCPSCKAEYDAFMNATQFFGIWQNSTPGPRFYGPFCAYSVNLTLYNENQSAVFVPLKALDIFNQYSQNNIPFVVFGGKYYKIGGFSNETSAEETIFKYVCLSINNSYQTCR